MSHIGLLSRFGVTAAICAVLVYIAVAACGGLSSCRHGGRDTGWATRVHIGASHDLCLIPCDAAQLMDHESDHEGDHGDCHCRPSPCGPSPSVAPGPLLCTGRPDTSLIALSGQMPAGPPACTAALHQQRRGLRFHSHPPRPRRALSELRTVILRT